MTNEEAQGMYNAGVAEAVEDRFAALRGTPDPEELDEIEVRPPAVEYLTDVDRAVIEAAKAIGKSRDGKTYCINEPQTIDGKLYHALDRALVARRVARGEPR